MNEDTISNDQPAEILVELNAKKVEYEAPINQVEKFKMDYHMDNNKPFDLKALDATFNSRKEAYEMLEIESIKKCKANVIRQYANARSILKTTVVCVTDRQQPMLSHCVCLYRAVIKKSRKRDDDKFYIEKDGRNLEHSWDCMRDSAFCTGNTTVGSKYMKHVGTMHPMLRRIWQL